jgi:hypothetical protein
MAHRGVLAGQLRPQAPQLLGMLRSVVHPVAAVPQAPRPGTQAALTSHCPITHRAAPGRTPGNALQSLPQRPQWAGSVWKFTQRQSVPHALCPGGHTHSQRPARQTRPAEHALPHAPQCAPSLARSTQEAPHIRRGSLHSVASGASVAGGPSGPLASGASVAGGPSGPLASGASVAGGPSGPLASGASGAANSSIGSTEEPSKATTSTSKSVTSKGEPSERPASPSAGSVREHPARIAKRSNHVDERAPAFMCPRYHHPFTSCEL